VDSMGRPSFCWPPGRLLMLAFASLIAVILLMGCALTIFETLWRDR
jgi:hypothetical protein